MSRVSHAASLAVALLAVVAYAGTARADVVKCQKTIAKESSKFLQAKTKAMQKCWDGVVKAGTGTCPNQKATDAIGKAAGKLSAGIDKACGGDDKVCGGNLTNEPDQDAIFFEQCPDVERSSCSNEMSVGCTGIAACLECMGEAVVDQVMGLYYGALILPSSDDLNKCQKAIGKATSQFLTSKSKALQKCWDGYLAGKNDINDGLCIPPALGNGKYLAAIQKAEAKKISAICKACGGADKACDGDINAGLIVSGGTVVTGTGNTDDLAPSAIGFASTCKDVTLPYQPSTACGTLDGLDGAPDVIDSLRELILCADCVTEFKADCMDAAQVPSALSFKYPAQCNVCTTGAPSGPCPTTLEVTANGTDADLDTGWKGVAHDQIIPTNGRITLNVSCSPENFPCGQCNLSGPIPNDGGPTFANQRCSHASWTQCTDNTACLGTCSGGTNAGETCNVLADCPDSGPGTGCSGGTCEFFFGAPLPLSAGNVPVCVLNQIGGPVSGTINLDDGTSKTNITLLARVYVLGTVDQPCPNCVAGTCDSGAHAGYPCTVNGSNVFGPVSLDCPPNAAGNSGNLSIILQNDTGTQTKKLSTDNPKCRLTGSTSSYCFCDTCNNANAEWCSTNADCPESPIGTPGICGGKRCQNGTEAGDPCSNNFECGPARLCVNGSNHGAPCTVNSQCPSGTCGGACSDGPNAGSPCSSAGASAQCGGVCSGGTNGGGACTADSACPGSTCSFYLCAGLCGHPGGQPTAPNECNPPDGEPDGCQPTANNEGECVDGPSEGYCSIEYFRGCLNDAGCDSATGCPACLPNQRCVFRNRECYTDNGVVDGEVKVSGTPDPPCAETYSAPSLGSMFCIAPTGASAVNSSSGLPGLGRLVLPVKAILKP